jgi:hypothetical protein
LKKLLILLTSLMLLLVACGETNEQPKEVSKIETESKDAEVENNEKEQEEPTEYNEVLLDSDNAKVTLLSITKVEDKTFDEEYHSIKLIIENKLDKTIVVQTDEVSVDDVMVTDDVWFSETVAGGKKANGEMKIQTYDSELPPLEKNLELLLLVIDEEDYDRLDEQSVRIEIK